MTTSRRARPAAGSRRSPRRGRGRDPGRTPCCRLPDEEPTWLARNAGLFVLPFLAAYFARQRQLDVLPLGADGGAVRARCARGQPLPLGCGLDTEALVILSLPVVLWFVVAYLYMGGTVRAHERRMDFVRFTGEWFIYYVLIALEAGCSWA